MKRGEKYIGKESRRTVIKRGEKYRKREQENSNEKRRKI